MSRRFVTTICILLSVVLSGQAQKRTYDEAVKAARSFFKTAGQTAAVSLLHMKSTRGGHRVLAKSIDNKQDTAAYYLFTNAQSGQLVIVSGDERMPLVLGYTDYAVKEEELPDGLVELLDGYKAQYRVLATAPTKAMRVAALYKGERQLKTADWGQGTPFNRMTPEATPTGCAATAMAIVMRYYQWPECGAGSKTHIWKDSVMTANFGQTHYDWDNMPLSYTTYTEQQAKAVALLMRHAGISVEMYYNTESSGANQSLVPGALQKYFRYAATARLLSANHYDAATWNGMMRNEIDNGRPVLYTGGSMLGRGSHGFVLDGYRDNLFHFNFGWSGSGNGYFAVSALNATDHSVEFANQQQAVVGIVPLKEDGYAPLILERDSAYQGYYTPLTTLVTNSAVDIHLSNLTALRDWKGQMQWHLCRADGTVVEHLGSKDVTMNGGGSQSVDFSVRATSNAEKGDHLCLMAREDGSDQWLPVKDAKGQNVVVQAFERKVPVVQIICDTKNATINDQNLVNVIYDGKPLLGSTYRYKVTFADGVAKSLVQVRHSGDYFQASEGGAIELTTDTLYIKAKGYMPSELVPACEVNVANAGELPHALLKVTPDADAIETLTIAGSLDDSDLQYLSSLQVLKSLDMENATIAEGLFGAPFKGFERLVACVLPRSLKQIGSETFKNCGALKSISLPVSLQATGNDLFAGCGALTDIYVHPSSPDCVAADAFRNIPNTDGVTIHVQQGLAEEFKRNSKWSSFSNFVDDLPSLPQKFSSNGIEYNAIYKGDGNYAEVAIPSGQTYYSGEVTIPASVSCEGLDYTVCGFEKTDGLSPFVGNPFVSSLNLQLRIDTLKAMQFMGCTNLSSLQLPTTLRYIDSECFRNCPMLMQITLPASVEGLGDNAFCGCQYLTDIYSYAMVPPTGSNGDNYPFAQCRPNNVTLHVPASCEEAYRTSGFWSKFGTIVGDLQSVATDITTTAVSHDADFPIKAAGQQRITIHLDRARSVKIFRLDGTLQRVVQLPCGRSEIWLDAPSILVAP